MRMTMSVVSIVVKFRARIFLRHLLISKWDGDNIA
jgi:hypothetical protein